MTAGEQRWTFDGACPILWHNHRMATTTTRTPDKTTPATSLRGYVIVLISTLLLSFTGILIKTLLVDFNMVPLNLAFWRVLIVTAALGLALLLVRRSYFKIRLQHLIYFIVMGVVGVGLHQLAWVNSVNLNGAAVATVLVYINPTIVALASVRVFGEKLDRTKIIALVLTLTGIILVAEMYIPSNLQLNGLGILVGLLTGITWASYAIIGQFVARKYSPWATLFYAFLFGALCLLPMQLYAGNFSSLGTQWMGWAILLFLSLGPTLVGFGLYTVGLSQIPASVVTLLATLEPVFSIILAYVLFGEVLDFPQIIGAGLILLAVLLLRPRTTVEVV
ncbi:MAG: EamA family transporter [Anaerolineae bacterium]|nr:EamA family transporter [Anaerolineae bacterium]